MVRTKLVGKEQKKRNKKKERKKEQMKKEKEKKRKHEKRLWSYWNQARDSMDLSSMTAGLFHGSARVSYRVINLGWTEFLSPDRLSGWYGFRKVVHFGCLVLRGKWRRSMIGEKHCLYTNIDWYFIWFCSKKEWTGQRPELSRWEAHNIHTVWFALRMLW